MCDDAQCRGSLKKCGVRYNSLIPKKPLKMAIRNSKKADVALVLGSSMTGLFFYHRPPPVRPLAKWCSSLVQPFCEMPFYMKGNKNIICTLQDTSYDSAASLKINTTCDDLMKRLMAELGLEANSFTYRQQFIIRHRLKDDTAPTVKMWQLTLEGGYPNEPCTCVGEIIVKGLPSNPDKEFEMEQERLVSYLDFAFDPERDHHASSIGEGGVLTLHLTIKWREEYQEPPLECDYKIDPHQGTTGWKNFEFLKTVSYA